MRVYGVTGLPGSGKSIVSRVAKKEGIYTISMGDVIRKEAEKNNCTSGEAAVNLRKKYGNNVVADKCIKQIITHSRNRTHKNTTFKKIPNSPNKKNFKNKKFKKVKQDLYLIEGLRSPDEVKYFKRHFKNFKVIAIHSSPQERFNRVSKRKRDDDTTHYDKFIERDERELNFGIGNVVALADYMLINEGHIQKFKKNIRMLIKNEIKQTNKYKPRKPNTKHVRKNKNKNKNNGKPNRRSFQNRKNYQQSDNRKQYGQKTRK